MSLQLDLSNYVYRDFLDLLEITLAAFAYRKSDWQTEGNFYVERTVNITGV